MLKTLWKTLEMDITYSTNSFIFILRKLPILKDLITDDIYSSKILKKIIEVISVLIQIIKATALKFFYFFVIFSLSLYYYENAMIKSYFHLVFVLTILGLFINNKYLNTAKKKYFSMILMRVDGTYYLRSTFLWNQFSNLFLNTICVFFFGALISSPIKYSICLITLMFFVRPVGEYMNLKFFEKKHYIWYSNTKWYYAVLFFFLGCALLPFLKIYITFPILIGGTILFVLLGSFCIVKIWNFPNYKLLYKKLTQITHIMDTKNEKDYLRQAMVSVREKDYMIDEKKLKGKKGYDFFNTIFFERHREILMRSARKYALVSGMVYIVVLLLIIYSSSFGTQVNEFLNKRLGIFALVMYFMNRGAIITQAMFFNCDHAMLVYNFYREPKTLLGLFKRRLETVVKVNLLPAFVVGIGNAILLFLTGTTSPMTLVSTFLLIIFLSAFFSTHYLVIYYLLQPFNKNLEVKKASYSFVTLGTYILTYQLVNVVVDSLALSIAGLLATILYFGIALFLVYRYAPRTFKLN